MQKINEAIECPFHWMRALTIPPCEDDQYDNRLVMLWPVVGLPVNYMLLTGFATFPTSWKIWTGFLVFDVLWIGYHHMKG